MSESENVTERECTGDDMFYKKCRLVDCSNRHQAKGLCKKHYYRLARTGSTRLATLSDKITTGFIRAESGCWEWTGYKDPLGYGRFRHNRRRLYAHRAAYEVLIGEIPEGLLVCHHCDNPSCINPEHLFLGTHKDNTQDCIEKGRFYPRGRRYVRG